MAISFTCEGCGKQYTVKDELAGKKAQCKKCNAVMKVPVPHREPNLSDDTIAGKVGETVSGTMHSLHGESLAGRSASGRSMPGQSGGVAAGSTAGKSMSGRSMSGSKSGRLHDAAAEQIEAAPQDDVRGDQYSYADAYRAKMEAKKSGKPLDGGGDGPSLEALKHVGSSSESALDYKGEAEPEIHRARAPAAKNYATAEPISFLLVVAFLGVLAYAVVGGTAAAPPDAHGRPFAPDVVAEAGKPWGIVAAPVGVMAIAAFAVVAPLVLAGWVIACKIANVRLPDGLYVRSLGIAVIPLMLIALGQTLPLGLDPQSVLLLGLLGVPAGYALLHFIHNQKPLVAGIATGAGTILAIIGIVFALGTTDTATAAMRKPYATKLQSIADRKERERLAALDQQHKNEVAVVSQDEQNKSDAAIKDVRTKLDVFKKGLANKQQTREKLAATVAELNKAIADGQAKFQGRGEWKTMGDELADAETAVKTFPSAVPPAEVAEAPPAGPDWSAKPGRREVSAFAFDLTPPNNATLDLDTSGGLVWHANDGPAKMTVEQVDLPTPSQQRPWVAPAFVLGDASAKAVSVADDDEKPDVEYGTLAGLPAAKVTVADAAKGGDTVVYTVHQGTTWLKCTIGPAAKDDAGTQAMLASIRSVHNRPAGATASDPFPAADLIARYPAARPADADRILELLKAKPNAEEAVRNAMGISPDDAAYEKFGPLLVATATDKSSRQLWKLAAANTPLADKARATLRTLEPKDADDLTFATLDIKDGNPRQQVQRGIATMANADFAPDRSAAVGRSLAQALDDHGFISSNSGPNLEAALEKWSTEDVAKRMEVLLKATDDAPATPMTPVRRPGMSGAPGMMPVVPPTPAVSTFSASPEETRLAMKVLASTHNGKYANLILQHVASEPDLTTDAIIGLGTPAEGAVIIKLKENDTTTGSIVRQACVKMLAEMGTARSLSPLSSMATISGSAEVKAGAKDAIDKIKARKAKPT